MKIDKEFQELRVLIDRQFGMENALIDKHKELQATADRRLVLLRDLVEAFEAVYFYSDEVDIGYTAYNLANKELADAKP